jgi:16S rRNA processing protein RimM
MTNNSNKNNDEPDASQAHRRWSDSEFVVIGRVVKPHGVRGEVCVFPMTDDSKRFNLLKYVFISNNENSHVFATVAKTNVRARDVVVKLEGVDTRDQAEKLRGLFFEIYQKDCMPLEEGAYYIFELIGMEVRTQDGQLIGLIEDVQDFPANDIYVVKSGGREVLIPVIADVVKSIDVTQGIVTIDPIEGLLD